MQAETGLLCRRIEPQPEFNAAEGTWKHTLAHLMLSEKERQVWYKLPEKGPRRYDWLFGRIAVKDAVRQYAQQTLNLELASTEIEILSTELGKPFLRCPTLEAVVPLPDISISHSRGYIVAAVAPSDTLIGIDLERLGFTRYEDWLSIAFSQVELKLLPQPTNQAMVVGFWCAKEAASKAIGTGLQGNPEQWAIASCSQDGQDVEVTYNNQSYPVKLWFSDTEVLALCSFKNR